MQLRRKQEAATKRSVGDSEDGPKLPKSWHKLNGSRASFKKEKLKLSGYLVNQPRRPRSGQLGQENSGESFQEGARGPLGCYS